MIPIMSHSIATIFDQAARRVVDKGAPLFFLGDPVTEVFFVEEGRIGLRRVSAEGGEMFLQMAVAGDLLAEGSVYSERYHCDGVAMERSRVAALSRRAFRDRLRRDPDLMEHWASRLAHAVQSARLRAEIRGLRTVAERLDMWLALRGGLPERGHWQEVAAELGVSREALYRELARRRDADQDGEA